MKAVNKDYIQSLKDVEKNLDIRIKEMQKNKKRVAEVYREYKEKRAITPKSGHEMAKEAIAKWKKYTKEHPTPKIEYQWKVLKIGDYKMFY